MRLHLGRCGAASTAFLAGAVLLTGCGGSSVGNSATARIRVVDASSTAGKADILINGASAFGDMSYFSTAGNTSQPASPYLYIGPQAGVPFTYTSSTLPSGVAAGVKTYTISQDQFYTAFLIGRPDTFVATPADPRFLQTIVPAPRAAANAGVATLRVLNAAPDAGFTPAVAPAAPVAGSINVAIGAPPATFSSVAYATASSYQTLTPGGAVPVTVTLPGGAAVVAGTISLSANTVYTLVVDEKTIPVGATPATYDLHLLSE